MFYTIYKITNKIDGKIYIGCHKSENPNDDYMGSGKYLINAQKKYGIKNFEKDILEVFDNPEAMFEMESKLVTTEFVERPDTYNLKEGGFGGFDHINKNWTKEQRLRQALNGKKNIKAIHDIIRERRKIDPEFDKLIRANAGNIFRNKKHTEETKMKIGESSSKHQVGTGNSQYDTMWIYSLEEKRSQKIKKDDLTEWESKGWLKGRKMKFF